jgi:hypothetical protein
MKKSIVGLFVLLGIFFTQEASAHEKSFSISFPIKNLENKPIGTSLRISDGFNLSCLVFSPPVERAIRDRGSLIKQTDIVFSVSLRLCF